MNDNEIQVFNKVADRQRVIKDIVKAIAHTLADNINKAMVKHMQQHRAALAFITSRVRTKRESYPISRTLNKITIKLTE